VHGLLSDGSSVVFMWIPGRVGLAGNSAADSAAKDALLLPVSSLTVPHSDYKSLNTFLLQIVFNMTHVFYLNYSWH